MADILDNYRRIVTATGATPRDRRIFDRVQIFNDTFKNAPEYEQIRVTNDSSNTTNYDTWIYSNSSYKQLVSMKTIIFAPGTPSDIVFSGQYIRPQRQGGLFMLYSDDKQYDQKLKGLMDECTETLRWYDKFGVLHTYPVIVRNDGSKSLDEDKYMTLTDGTYMLGIPFDTATSMLDEGDQFILKRRHKYRIAGFDDIKSDTYMEMKMSKYETNPSLSELTTGIANYLKRPIYSIEVSQSASQLSIGQTFTLNATLRRATDIDVSDATWNDILAANPNLQWDQLTADTWVQLIEQYGGNGGTPTGWIESDIGTLGYSSSDTSVAVVSSTGSVSALSNGTTNIRVFMVENPDVFVQFTVSVVATPVDNITYAVSPDIQKILRLQNETFEVQKYNNNIPETETYTITVHSSTTANSSDYEFETVGNNGYRIKNLRSNDGIVIQIVPDGDTGNTFTVSYELSNGY